MFDENAMLGLYRQARDTGAANSAQLDAITPLYGTSAPTTATAGIVNQLYLHTITGDVYICTSNAGGVYTWKTRTAPLATYTHTTNKEVAVSAVDVDANTFTANLHGYANGDMVYVMLNLTAGSVFLVDKIPGGISPGKRYYVINAETNTFQISESLSGAAVNIASNANIDVTKWHFERFSAEVTISNLPNLRRALVRFKGRVLRGLGGSYITPNSVGLSNWFRSNGALSNPDLALGGDVMVYAEVLFDANGRLMLRSMSTKMASATSSTISHTSSSVMHVKLDQIDISITSISTSVFEMANGSVLEVYAA